MKYTDVVDSGQTMTTVANVGLVAGITGLVGGAAMILLGGPSKHSARATLDLSPSSARLRLAGAWW